MKKAARFHASSGREQILCLFHSTNMDCFRPLEFKFMVCSDVSIRTTELEVKFMQESRRKFDVNHKVRDEH